MTTPSPPDLTPARYRTVWTHRTARALFCSQATSTIGDWLGVAGLLLLSFDRSGGQAIGPGGLLAAQGVASVITTGLVVRRVDTVDRRAGLAGCYLAGLAALAVAMAPTGIAGLWVAAAVLGAVRPVAAAFRHALAGAELPDDVLGPTVAATRVVGDVAAAVGLAAGSAVAVAVGPHVAIGLDAVTFAAAAALCVWLPAGSRGQAAGVGLGGNVRFVLGDRRVAPLVWAMAGMATVSSLPAVLAPTVATGPLLVWVLAAQSVGQAAGAVAAGRQRWLEAPVWLAAALAGCVPTLLLAAAAVPVAWLLGVANLAVGVVLGVGVAGQTGFARACPPQRLGAATASAIAVTMVVDGVGAVSFAALGDAAGPAAAYVAGAAVVAVSVAVWAVAWRRSGPTPAG